MKKKYLPSLMTLPFVLFILLDCAPKHEQETLSADNIVISYHVEGKGNPALVFVHGWCCDKSYWKHQVPYFAEKYKVITIDLAGHGKSGLGRKTWSIEAFGKDVVAVLEQENVNQAILIGHSMGGPVIVETARQSPKHIIGLVGVDTFFNFEETYSQEQIEAFISPFLTDFIEATHNFVRGMFTQNSDTSVIEQIVDDMSSAPPEVGIGAMREVASYNVSESLKDIQIPIVCINSDQWPTNIEVGQKHAVSFKLKLMPGIGHFVMIEEPDKFNKLLNETINELIQ